MRPTLPPRITAAQLEQLTGEPLTGYALTWYRCLLRVEKGRARRRTDAVQRFIDRNLDRAHMALSAHVRDREQLAQIDAELEQLEEERSHMAAQDFTSPAAVHLLASLAGMLLAGQAQPGDHRADPAVDPPGPKPPDSEPGKLASWYVANLQKYGVPEP